MAEVPEIVSGGNEDGDIVFNPSDYGGSETLAPVKEENAPVPDGNAEKADAVPGSWLENRKTALIIGVIGFIVVVIVFVFLFSTIDWNLIMNPPVNS